MAEHRRLADLTYGHVGTLTYIPRRDATQQSGALYASRDTFSAPHLKVVGSSAELYPPSKSKIPEGSSQLWQERRKQKRWLLKSHPEAFMGNVALQGMMEENMDRFQKFEGEASDRPLLAIGQMTNIRDPSRVTGAQVLAVATGESGELLRLARVDESKWQWGQNKDVDLKLSVIDPDDQEEEVIWASDGLPISQIKFATSLSRYDSVRWLLVQKNTSTVILQPEYHRVPVIQKQTSQAWIEQRMSRIDPNPILTISHKETGGNAHTDVAFNPGSRGHPAQIAIIDECGYWTIWNTPIASKAAQAGVRPSMFKRGHIWEGFLEEIPLLPSFSAEKHGLLYVGTAEIDSFWEEPTQTSEEDGPSAVRSQHVLLWNRDKFDVSDLASGTSLQKLPSLNTAKAKPDYILDVQLSPVDRNHIFILTHRYLYWIDLFKPSTQEEQPPNPSILLACPHLIEIEGLRMTSSRTTAGDTAIAMVLIHSPQNQQIQAYWFRFGAEKHLPCWHRRILTLPSVGKVTPIHSIDVRPAPLLTLGTLGDGPGSQYQRAGVQFYQGSILGSDLSVRYCICASYQRRDFEVILPSLRMGHTKADLAGRWKRKRKHFLRHMGTTFVLPDGMTEADIQAVVRPNYRRPGPALSLKDDALSSMGPISLKLDRLCSAIRRQFGRSRNEAEDGVSPALVSAIQETMDMGTVRGKLPLTTWQQIASTYEPPDSNEMQGQIDLFDFFERADDEAVVTYLGRDSPHESTGSLVNLAQLNSYFARLWLEPLEGRMPADDREVRRGWIAELAREVFLSSYGVMVQDTRLLGPGSRETAQDTQTQTQSQSQRRISSSIPIKSSQSSAPSMSSSPPVSATVDAPDPAIQRLQLLAPSLRLDKMKSAKQSSVLSYWPSDPGTNTQDYVSSVAVASDKQFDDARERLKRLEARRKAHAEKYKLPAFMRQNSNGKAPQSSIRAPPSSIIRPSQNHGFRPSQTNNRVGSQRVRIEEPPETQPVPIHAMSSQAMPHSSQSQGGLGPSFAMSQPVSGVFGDRKKVKKGKRKSGFR